MLLSQGPAVCSGALIEGDRVVTAWHCVAGSGRARVEFRDGTVRKARLSAARRRDDLAVLDLDAPVSLASLPVGPVPTQGDAWSAWGHPYGAAAPGGFLEGTLRWSRMDGVVSAVGSRAVQLDSPLAPGMSGGPVVDAEGRLVGVVSRRLGAGGPGFAARVDDIPAEGGRGPGLALSTGVWGAATDGAGDPLAVGLRGELAIGGRVVLGLTGSVAPTAAPSSLRWGSVSWPVAEGTAGVRQTLGRGTGAVSFDAFAGGALVQSADVDATDTAATWLAGAAVAPGIVRADVALLGTGDVRVGLGLRLPAPSATLRGAHPPP